MSRTPKHHHNNANQAVTGWGTPVPTHHSQWDAYYAKVSGETYRAKRKMRNDALNAERADERARKREANDFAKKESLPPMLVGDKLND